MIHNINRRSFIKQSSIGGTGLLFGSSLLSSASDLFSRVSQARVIGGLVPVSVIEDTGLLLIRSGNFSGDVEYAIASDLHTKPAPPGNKGRLASVLPANDSRLISLFTKIRDNKELPNRTAKIAIAFGWICHNAVAKSLQNLYNLNVSEEETKEMQTYLDAQLIKEISFLNIAPELKEEHIASLFNEILPRAITRIHTLTPAADGPEWVNRMSEWRINNKIYFGDLARIIINPDSFKKEKYIDKPNFYSSTDSIISCCRSLQSASNVKPEKIKTAAAEAATGSLYAKALGESYNNILAANQYLNGNLNERELENKLF